MRVLRWEPSQGARKFIGEIAIVALGVLMALGLEQLIVSFNARQGAAEAREIVRYEIGTNLGSLANRFRTTECISRRLGEIGEFIEAADNAQVEQAPRWLGRPQVWIMDNARWQAASDAGRASLFSLKEQSTFSDIYGSFRSVEETQLVEQIIWAQLRSLEGQQRLSETSAASMRSLLSQARYTHWRIGIGYAQALEQAEEMGIPVIADPANRGSHSVCIAIDTPRELAIKQTGSTYGEP
jgi:hypothetical protein